MYKHCIFCHTPLGSNPEIEQFPVGRRLAFDPARGRLWVVCVPCGGWNLTPLETRWEAIEECERLFRRTPLRAHTDQIGLARVQDALDLIRIGEPLRPELAIWRYGERLRKRWRPTLLETARVHARAGVVAIGVFGSGSVLLYVLLPPIFGTMGTMMALQAIASVADHLARNMVNKYRELRVVCRLDLPDGQTATVRATDAADMRLRLEPRGWHLQLTHEHGVHFLYDQDAIRTCAVLLPFVNEYGAQDRTIRTAVKAIEDAGAVDRYFAATLGEVRRRGYRYSAIAAYPAELRVGLEIAAQEEFERRALVEGELPLLERAWRDAEAIAAIADNLLLPPWVSDRIDRMKATS